MIGESGLAWDELDDQFEDAARLVVQNQLGSIYDPASDETRI